MMHFALRPLAKNKTPTLYKIVYFQRIYQESIEIIFSGSKIRRKKDEKVCLSYQPKQTTNLLFFRKKNMYNHFFSVLKY